MGSLISDADKASYQNELLQVFDTWKRPFIAYFEPQKVVVSSNPNFSRFGNNSQNSTNVPLTPQPVTILGVIKHTEKQPYFYMGGDDAQIKIKNANGECKIKVRIEDAKQFMGIKLFEVDGFSYRLKNTTRPHGLFTPALYTFYLERTE